MRAPDDGGSGDEGGGGSVEGGAGRALPRLGDGLRDAVVAAAAVPAFQGDMEAADRDAVVNEFRDGVTKIHIATDVLSRGFDVSQVTLVVNYDVPVERDARTPAYDTYLHRIGRSGRFGRKGAAFNLVCGEQVRRAGVFFLCVCVCVCV